MVTDDLTVEEERLGSLAHYNVFKVDNKSKS